MIVFDLVCGNDHHFEGWFESLSDLEDQIKNFKIVCPICGETHITRRPSTFGLVKHRASGNLPAEDNPSLKLFKQLETLTEKLNKEFDDVGTQFMSEALKMHYGVVQRRNIRGLSTEDEEEILKKEGVDFFKVPLWVRKDSNAN
ncbi:MAG: DUF1178 family protein [Deltaproteobacteria bacterium]|jgi:hypothetical protein|nr:DUF1178 family protein [Deltaproteobacteria bacterium]